MAQEKNKKWIGKAAVVGLIVLGIFAFRYFDLGQYLSLDYLKSSREKFQALYQSQRVLVIAAYMGIYIVVTALSLPGAAVMTLAGGGLFGLTVGTVAVSFASTIGATLACVVSRFLLREWVQNKFGDKLATINAGIEKEGAFYLFSLRLVPVFPFFVINLLMGLTRMRLFTFFWVSQIGMLAGTIVYVNAGKELAQIDSLAGILSPGVLISFAVLGLFPITVKKLLALYKRKIRKSSESATVTNNANHGPCKAIRNGKELA
ncbi:MAG: TVP38/TMEM64 family protein [Desulfobacterales bacterium]